MLMLSRCMFVVSILANQKRKNSSEVQLHESNANTTDSPTGSIVTEKHTHTHAHDEVACRTCVDNSLELSCCHHQYETWRKRKVLGEQHIYSKSRQWICSAPVTATLLQFTSFHQQVARFRHHRLRIWLWGLFSRLLFHQHFPQWQALCLAWGWVLRTLLVASEWGSRRAWTRPPPVANVSGQEYR